MSFELALKE